MQNSFATPQNQHIILAVLYGGKAGIDKSILLWNEERQQEHADSNNLNRTLELSKLLGSTKVIQRLLRQVHELQELDA